MVDNKINLLGLVHQSFVSTAPPGGWVGIMTFQSPCISPALWGQADSNSPPHSPALHNRKSHRGECPNVIPGTSPSLRGQSKSNCPAP